MYGAGDRMTAREVATAKAICSRCPVRLACLDDALTYDERAGIWGGLTYQERRALIDTTRGNLAAALVLAQGR